MFDILFVINSIALGAALAMDAFSVSIANGINEPKMKIGRSCAIAGVYAFFQFAMPMIGWICVHTIVNLFTKLQVFIPWIALALLAYIGGKMIYDGIKSKDSYEEVPPVTFKLLMVQGIATSIDALSVGFAIEDYNTIMALVASVIIAVVTFAICMVGLKLGNKIGNKIAEKATIVGGIILIIIGLEICIKGLIG